MAVLDRIPSTQVKLVDIRDTINAFGGSASDNLTSFFQENDMNMWAKYKFTIVPDRDFIDDDKRWQGGDGMCGLNIPQYASPSQMRTALVSGDAAWSYKPPQGGVKQPMRLGDARHYTYKAVNPIGAMAGSYILSANYEFDINIEIVVQSSDYNLTLSDIAINGVKLNNMYMGVYLKPVSGSGYYWGGSSSKIGSNGELTMRLKGHSGLTGEFDAYVFLSTTSQASAEVGGTFIGINKPVQRIKIMSSGTQYLLNVSAAVVEIGGKQLYYEAFITNNNQSSQTFTNIYVRIQRYINGSWQNEGVAQLIKSSVTIAGNTTILAASGTLTHSTAFGLTDVESGNYRIYAYSTTPAITGEPTTIEPPSPTE